MGYVLTVLFPCDKLVFRPGVVKDSRPFNTTETGDKRRLHGPLKDLAS